MRSSSANQIVTVENLPAILRRLAQHCESPDHRKDAKFVARRINRLFAELDKLNRHRAEAAP